MSANHTETHSASQDSSSDSLSASSFTPTKKVMLSAVQPTNEIMIGNYLGAIRNWVKLQKEYDCLFFAVDLHAITIKQDPKELLERTYRAIATYIACGIDPDQCTLFAQSHVREHAELAWILTCNSTMGELSRMTQFKDKSSKQGQHIPTGLFTYPVLMAADILLYQTHLVPVGDDQKQHLELTRDLAQRMNHTYPGTQELFVMPEPYIPPVGARIMSLQNPDAKMSKSDPDPHATLYLTDSDDTLTKKLKRAVTDSGSEITYTPEKAGVKNLIDIQCALTGKTPQEIVESYKGKMYGHLKMGTAEVVVESIRPIREKILALMSDRAYLNQILKKGADNARKRARPVVSEVYSRLGFIPWQ